MKQIPFLKPNLVKKDAYCQYLDELDNSRLYSNFGPLNTRFEARLLHEYFAGDGAITTVNNATIGLMLAIAESRRPNAKYALMPSFTFAATPLAAMWCGLEPYFIDVGADDWCMDEILLQEAIQELGERVAVVVPYATFGTSFNLDYYSDLQKEGVPVVVDAAASFGTTDEHGQFGKGFAGAVVFSFHATKSFGIGEGGAVYSGSHDRIARIRQAANFGFSDKRETCIEGLNAKLPEISAAVALATLDVFPQKIDARQEIYREYVGQFKQWGLFEQGWEVQKTSGRVPFQFFAALCPKGRPNKDVISRLQREQIECRHYFSPACHQQSHFSAFPYKTLSVTEAISQRVLSLPLWEEMTANDVALVVRNLAGKD